MISATEKTAGQSHRPDDEPKSSAPSISLPKGGGAIRGIGEKFAANPVTGTGSMSVPIATSLGRSGFGPQLALAYDSGASNGPFGFGWSLSLPSITRKTDKGLPQYRDAEESDVFILSGAEDLVPVLNGDGTRWSTTRTVEGEDYRIHRYRPRIEGLFARIERWTRVRDGDVHWRSISRDNILTLYGKDTNSRIADPDDPTRIFSWLICETRDDKGNAVVYEYKPEDSERIFEDLAGNPVSKAHERNRTPQTRSANRYIKRIRYGNRTPLLDNQGRRPIFLNSNQIQNAGWLFEVVFDYGEHDEQTPTPTESQTWPVRPDPFSTYRGGFEVRTYRLCQRVLMFHHIPDLPTGEPGYDGLVRSTDLTYAYEQDPTSARTPVYSFLNSVTQCGYKRNGTGYLKRSLPPLEFSYSLPLVQEIVEEVDAESLENLPAGLDGGSYQWTDLHGEGVPGILTEQGSGWFYKRNLSPLPVKENGKETVRARFAPVEPIAVKPNLALAAGAQFMDLAGDGQPDLVVTDGPMAGLYEHDENESWQPFRPFTAPLNRNLRDPNLRFVDLDGDGHADVLITEDDAFVWHASLAEEGFGPARRVAQAMDEEKGPRLVFADGTQSIYLADMSGDGLTDLVRIRNGEVCYWPNLGYGRFGAKVTMDHAPWFDTPDQFDQRRIRLADIDGSGTTDIIYLHRDGVRLYFNQSGNSWSAPRELPIFPRVGDLVHIQALDLLGNGTAYLVWSSPLPGDARRPLRYVRLLAEKPHLLVKTVNNLGAETRVQYAPSTRFYLADKLAGKPWITRLPFPVHVVERVETYDHISRNRFVTRYAYHHGYFDGEEREFRGFGMVEQWDTEAFEDYVVGVQRIEGDQELAPELYQPPVTIRTWYHTGACFARSRILHQFRDEYYRKEQHLPEPALPPGLDAHELRECLRALKGLPLRQEIYSFDGSAQEQHPYTVVENTYEIRLLQPRGTQKHAVFFPIGRESVTLNYERNPFDPRIAHSLSLEVDEYGNVRKSCSVVYGRKIADPSLPSEVTRDQQKTYVTYTEVDYTPDIDRGNPTSAYRLRVPYESRSYEITGIAPASDLFQLDEIKAQLASTTEIAYEVVADGVTAQKRLLSHSRTLFLDNNLNPLPLGHWDTLGLKHQSYEMAFTPSIISAHYTGKVSDAEFAAAGYVHFDGDANWWVPSGMDIYPTNARDHFYIPIGFKDPLGVETVATLDQYDLLIEKVEVRQAPWNVVTAVNDYRILGPFLITDPNKNRSAVEYDELGMVVKTAIMGKAGSVDGDTLADPTTRMEYELFNWMNHRKPNFVHTFAREQHGAANPRWQESYTYFNGSGGVAMVKAQAHPGKAFAVNPDGTKVEVFADPRWVGNGRTILNNKGKPVKQYEPYFSTTHEYEDEKVLREIGVTPILYYDPIGRNIRTLFPNGTFARVEFTPWMQKVFDANDTVKESQWYADRGSPDPATQPEPLNDPERRAAWLAAKHADTPGVIHFDSLGRPIYAVSDYGGGKKAAVRSENDLTGRFSKIFDQEQREVASGFVGMTGIPIVCESAEKGRRWMFQNVLGALVKTWDEYGRQFRIEYDVLHRPVSAFVQEAGQAEILFNHVVYGDRLVNAEHLNLLGTAHLIFDQAGMVRIPEMDFKGNPKSVQRILAKEYKSNLDWNAVAGQPDVAAIQAAADPALETSEVFTASSEYDALNRPTRVLLPDATVILLKYNEANFLESLRAQIRGQGNFIEFLKKQDYDAKGQRQFAHYGNDVFTRYFYDPKTFRLTNLLTYKSGTDPQSQSLQNLRYTYDPVGNITQIRDDAQQTHYFNNAVVKPENLYEYDAIYQLIRATGRELAGLGNDTIRTHTDLDFFPQLPHPSNTDAVRTYTEEYEYDVLGNLRVLRHRFAPQAGVGSGWTRRYRYAFDDNPGNRTNRLTATSIPGDPDGGPFSATYDYDAYGNMTRMPHLAAMDWNFLDQLRRVELGGGGTAYYVYGLGGQRLRKVIERNGNTKLEWIFLGAVMIFRRRRRDTNALRLERWTVHISDNVGHIAQVDTKTRDDDNSEPASPLNIPLVRYQYTNHLGSTTLETDEHGNVISYEEYHPYGTTAYRSAKPGFNLSLKRFRFSGKERDDETGLYYFGARYYAPWLGRWTSADPANFVSSLNLFRYCGNNPVVLYDPTGMQEYDLRFPLPPGNAEQLRRYVLRLGYRWTRDGAENPSPIYSGGEWIFGVFDPEHIPEGDPLGIGDQRLPTPAPAAENNPDEIPNPSSEPSPPSAESRTTEPPESGTELAPATDAARAALQEGARPRSVTGARPRGTLHLWSGEEGKAEARAAIRSSGSGWMMGDINGEPTPEHAAAEEEFNRARARARGGRLPRAEFERIWGPRSASVVGRAAFAGHPVASHGTPAPTSIQVRYERPARAVGGGLGGGLFFGTGMFTAITGARDPNPGVAVPLVIGGVAEATSGIMYAAGAVGGSTEAMAIGTAGGVFFGGATAAFGFGVASARSFERGDTVGGVVNALGAVGGVLMVVSLFTPLGWVAAAGTGLVLLAAVLNLARWFSD
ncbi:SpvB/TcaC N-terminal domain-containing protein [Roseiflexus sp.]